MAIAISIPVVATLLAVAEPQGPIWEHLQETVLHEYVLNSLALMALTGAISLVLGVGTGWLIGACSFKGRETLSWLLMLPLAAPAYIVAYVYTDLLEVSGPVLTALRSLFSLDVLEMGLTEIFQADRCPRSFAKPTREGNGLFDASPRPRDFQRPPSE